MKRTVVSGLGWLGALLILGAYVLVSYQVVTGDSVVFQLMNLFGSVGLVVSSLAKKDYQPAFLNIVFGAIATTTLVLLVFR